MNTEQRQAYGWAKTHDYPSIAARYARALASAVDDLQAQLLESQRRERAAVEVVRCKDCRWKDTVLCRASKSVKYDLRREKHTYQTCMEPDGFCSIGERGHQEAWKGDAE